MVCYVCKLCTFKMRQKMREDSLVCEDKTKDVCRMTCAKSKLKLGQLIQLHNGERFRLGLDISQKGDRIWLMGSEAPLLTECDYDKELKTSRGEEYDIDVIYGFGDGKMTKVWRRGDD